VPAGVQDKILDICNQRLAPNGIAYISYNTYPGWHLRGMIRDMMKYHSKHFNDPVVRVKQARNLLDFLARALEKDKSPYSLNLKAELELLRHCRDSYLFHEHLEDANEPVYFYQFAERAAAKSLRYLGEADFSVMVPGNYPPEISNVLHMVANDLIHMEQYMDFLRNRTFRQSLLGRTNLAPQYKLSAETVKKMYVGSRVKPVSAEPNLSSDEPEQFQSPEGAILASKKPIMKAAMLHLSRIWPATISFAALCEQARGMLGATAAPTSFENDAQVLANGILTTYASVASHMLELHTTPAPYVTVISEKPLASPYARHQAETSMRITSLRHEQVELEAEFDRQLLRLLDGRRTHDEIRDALAEAVAAGDLVISQDGTVVQDQVKIRELFSSAVERQLSELAKNALLLA
jgi:methyltransferase-like protein